LFVETELRIACADIQVVGINTRSEITQALPVHSATVPMHILRSTHDGTEYANLDVIEGENEESWAR